MSTGIEWTDATWNPIAGCSNVSEGCRNCYARAMARRLEAMGSGKYTGLTVKQGSKVAWTGKIAFDEDALLAPLRRRKPTRYFVNSMSDLFHPGVADEQIDRIFAVMALCPQHTFRVLTKRPERMWEFFSPDRGWWQRVGEVSLPGRGHTAYETIVDAPLPNVWLGVSVEDQR